MQNMFQHCISLKFLDLINFNTSSVIDMGNMFYNCHSLISLKIDDFNLSKVKSSEKLFYNCTSLNYLNLTNFYTLSYPPNDMFWNCSPKLVYCIDEQKEYQIQSQLQNFIKSCVYICIIYNSKKYIIEDNFCIDNCSTEIMYKYDYNNICYESCPNNTYLAKDKYTCISIIKNKNNNSTFIIIGIIIGIAIIIIVVVVIIIIIQIRKKYLIKVVFKKGGITNEINANPNIIAADLIQEYNKKYNKNNKQLSFKCGNNFLEDEENKKKEIRNFISKVGESNILYIQVITNKIKVPDV